MAIEVASNDGYLLQHFVAMGIPVLGVEPAANVAQAAIKKGVPTRVAFFGRALANELAGEGLHADLVVGNNVLAQVPDVNDFVAGIRTVLKPDGVATLEFPHLQQLIEHNQFDTIYHEHYSYFSVLSVGRIVETNGLRLFHVEELPTHGGSLRLYLCRSESTRWQSTAAVAELRQRERALKYDDMATYAAFGEKVKDTKRRLLTTLIDLKNQGVSIVGYGAPGKGNTLLNYCGIRTDFVDYLVDRNPYKHGRFTPGTHIPIHPVERVDETKPDYLLILPWNLKDEIMAQMGHIGVWGGRFIVPIPEPQIVQPFGAAA